MALQFKLGRRSKFSAAVYWVLGMLAIGYVPTLYQGDFRVSMVAAAAAAAVCGMRAMSLLGGLMRGAGLGFIGGLAIVVGLAHFQAARKSVVTAQDALLSVVSCVVLCSAVAVLFAHLARKRRQRIEDEWR